MRILLTTCPNFGHFFPMTPLAWALRNAGHDVLAAVPSSMLGVVTGAGVPAVDIGDLVLQSHDDHAEQDTSTAALVSHVVQYYVPLAEQAAERTIEVARSWGADMVISPSWEYAGPLAAAVLDIPFVFHAWGVVPPAEIDPAVAAALAPLHRKHGLSDGVPAPAAWIDVCPPTLRDREPEPGALEMTYVAYNGSAVLPDWLLTQPERPRVCVTLGNIPIIGDHESVVANAVSALRDLDVEIIIAASTRLRLDGDLGPRTRVARGLPLSHLLPTCSAVIHHGGAGSTMTSLVNGLPSLVLPQMCVQYQHAERVAAVGAGINLVPAEADVESIRAAMRAVLGGRPELRSAAQALAAQLADRPSPDAVARKLVAAVGLAGPTLPREEA